MDSISVSIFKPGSDYVWCGDLEDDDDDLYLMDEGWVAEWLGGVGGRLRSVSISDFWMQSCWRWSDILASISSCCHCLVELELKNAWLSVDRLKQMTSLTSLSLEFIRLDDDNLNIVNKCFPSLQVLKLIWVGGLTDPKIQLSHLRNCEWSASNAPISLTILAPSLVNLKLKCVRPKSIYIDTPLLSDFLFSLEETNNLEIKETRHLKNLQLVTKNVCNLLYKLPVCKMVENLRVDTPISESFNSITALYKLPALNLERLFEVFPNRKSLVLGPRAWWEAECCYTRGESNLTKGTKGLKEITAYIYVDMFEITSTFICMLVLMCSDLRNVSLLIQRGVDSSVRNNLIARCIDRCSCSKVRWRWGYWGGGAEDLWVD